MVWTPPGSFGSLKHMFRHLPDGWSILLAEAASDAICEIDCRNEQDAEALLRALVSAAWPSRLAQNQGPGPSRCRRVDMIESDNDACSDLRSLVTARPGFVLVSEASSGPAAIAAAAPSMART